VESEIFKAFDAIHELGVFHNDIRAENILVDASGESVFIIDFGFSEIFTELTDENREYLSVENDMIKEILEEIKRPKNYTTSRKAADDDQLTAGLKIVSN
jgi:serine/threonine protein kinase